MDPILTAIDDALKKKGLSDAAASKLAVGHPSLIKNFRAPRSGEKRYNVAGLQKLADVLDLEFYFGPKRYAEPELVTTIGSDDFTPVRVYTAEASAGPGLLNPEEDRIGTLAFKRTWLQQIGLNPAKSSILRVKGDSMEPTIKDGSIILVDEQKKQPVGNSIFAFIEDDELRIKRLDVIDGGKSKVLTITSDNPDYPSEVRINSDINKLRVLGQVVWTGYNLKESDK
jgi:phage repressor protein C with HTH and peptisase S24 domain